MIDRILAALADGCADCAQTLRRGKGKVHCPLHDDRTPSLDIQASDNGTPLLFCHSCRNSDGIIAELRARDLWSKPASVPTAAPREVARYHYQNPDGSHAYDIIRSEPKTFRASRTIPEAERVIYHLPEVLAAVAAKQVVHVVEGEKDADALRSIGLIATCNPFGAGKFLDRYAEPLIRANVVVWADKDDAGRKHATDVAQKVSVAARSVKIIESPVGKDAADAVEAGATALAIEVLVDDTPEWESSERVIYTSKHLADEYREILVKRKAGDPEYIGWPMGFKALDREMVYSPGDLVLLAGNSGVGKSTLLASLERRATVPTMYFSVEMSRTQLMNRRVSAATGIDSWKIRRGALSNDEYAQVMAELDRIEQDDQRALVDNPSLTTAQLESILRIARVRFNVRVAYVDHVGRLTDKDGESGYERTTNIAKALARIARSTGTAIVAAVQVNRKGDRLSGEPPFKSEMRDSGVLEEEAAIVLALGRAEGATATKLAVRKNRHGIDGFTVDLVFDMLHSQFLEQSEARLDRVDARMEIPI